MVKIGHSKKYVENFSASKVAEVTMMRKSFLLAQHFFNKPNKTSVWIVLSCASSSMMTEYCDILSSNNASLKSIPSVMYLITVSSLVQSSKRMA